MHVRDNGMGEEEVVVVTTDIEAPTDIPFVMADADSKGRYTLNANDDEGDNEDPVSHFRRRLSTPDG